MKESELCTTNAFATQLNNSRDFEEICVERILNERMGYF